MIYTNWTTFRAGFYDAATLPGTDPDGVEKWPLAKVRTVGFTSITRPTYPLVGILATNFPITILATGALVADSVYGVNEYDWYVDQRTDDPTYQYLAITQKADTAGPLSYSGALEIRRTTLGTSIYPSDFPLTPDDALGLFRHVSIYVQRRSDKAIQVMRPLDTLLASLP